MGTWLEDGPEGDYGLGCRTVRYREDIEPYYEPHRQCSSQDNEDARGKINHADGKMNGAENGAKFVYGTQGKSRPSKHNKGTHYDLEDHDGKRTSVFAGFSLSEIELSPEKFTALFLGKMPDHTILHLPLQAFFPSLWS